MFDRILQTPRVTAMAQIIHEMCCHAHHLNETFGGPLHRYFLNHPMLKSHRAPTSTDRDQVHIFWLGDGMQCFEVMVCDGQQDVPAWVSIAPDCDFLGVNMQSGHKGRYMVRIDRSLLRPQGRLATKLKKQFVSTYDAVDLGI